MRRPQDVRVHGEPPPLDGYRKGADHYAAQYARKRDADALWGLVASDAQAWCAQALGSDDPDVVSDAAGVAAWLDASPELLAQLEALLDTLPDSEVRDSVAGALPQAVLDVRNREEDEAARTGPVPFLAWFVEAPLAVVHGDYVRWAQESIDPDTHYTPLSGTLPELLARLEPFEDWWQRWLFVACGSRWTAVLTTGFDASWVDRFATRLDVRVLRTHVADDDVAFWLSQPGGDWETHRAVQVTKDSGWSFHADGPVQDFEETERYTERLKTKRFDPAMLDRYCAALGICRSDPAFYGPEAVLVAHEMEALKPRRRRWWQR